MLKAATTNRKPLKRSRLSAIQLEPRFMFDGAAIDTALDVFPTQDVFERASQVSDAPQIFQIDPALSDLTAISVQAQEQVRQFLAQASNDQLFALFNGGSSEPDAQWIDRMASLREALADGSFKLHVLEMDSASQFNAVAAFTQEGPNGEPTVFINRFWFEMFDAPDASRALIEELGHAMDAYLNLGADTPGDEGESFAAAVKQQAGEPIAMALNRDDSGSVTYAGQSYQAEFASLNFVNAYEMVYDQDNDTSGGSITTAAIDVTERWAAKEQNSHYFNASVSLGVTRMSDGTNGQSFSGNDVSGSVAVTIGSNTYYGWVSRPIKANGIVRGFYFWRDTDFTTLQLAQDDGNMDGDSSVLDNEGFLLVVDQDWFDSQISSTGVSKTINNNKDGNLGSITVANVGSSSDRVDTALNSVLPPNSSPTAANDKLTIGEDSGTTSVTAANGLLSNDSDVNNDTLTITTFSVGGVSTTVDPTTGGSYVIPSVGTIQINKDGSYSFTPVANYSGTVPPITYNVSDSNGGTATAVLSIEVTPSNDAPTGTDDSVTTAMNTPKVLSVSDFGTFTDPESDPLAKIQITTLATNGILQYWNGTTWASVTLNQEITVTQLLLGQVRFSPDDNESGSNYATVGYKVSDGTNYSASAYTLTVNVTAGNQDPAATNDTKTVAEEGCSVAAAPGTGNVLTDGTPDSDPESASLSVTAIDAYGNTQTVASGSTSASGGRSITGAYGTLVIGANGSYTYTLNEDLASIDSMNTSSADKTETFTYTVSDGTNTDTATLTITITGTNDAPVAADDFSTLREGSLSGGNYGTVDGNALANDSDVDSTEYIAGSYATGVGSAAGEVSYTFTVSSAVAVGDYVFFDDDGSATTRDLALTNSGAVGEAVKLTVLYGGTEYDMRVKSVSGNSATFKIVVGGTDVDVGLNDNKQGFTFGIGSGYVGFSGRTDTGGGYKVSAISASQSSASSTVNISVLSAGVIAAGMTVTDGIDTRTVTGVAKDANGNVTSVTLDNTVTWASANLTFSANASPLVLTGKYGQISINTTTGAYTYTLTSDALGPNEVFDEKFGYRLTDGSCTDDAVITIRVVGTAAPLLADDTLVVTEDTGDHETFNGAGAATATDNLKTNDTVGTNGVTLGDIVSFTISGDATTYTAGQTATITGVGTLLIRADGTISFNPVDDYVGSVPDVRYSRLGSDSVTYYARLLISINPSDDSSVLAPDENSVPEDTTATGNVLSNDSDVDSVLSVTGYSWNNGSSTSNGTVGSATNIVYNGVTVGSLTLSANGSYSFTPTANWNGTVPVITYTAGGSTSTLSITVTPVNDSPVLDLDADDSSLKTGADFTRSYTNGAAAVSIADTDSSITDVDDSNIEQATIVLTNAQVGDLLSVGSLPAGISVLSGPTTSNGETTIVLTGSASKASYEAAIEAITFSSSGNSTTDRIITVNVSDGTVDSNTAYSTIVVSPDNRALTVTGTTVNEASPYVQFQVGGVANQWATLSLADGTTGTAASKGLDFLPNLQYFDGTSWLDYTGGAVQIPTGGILLVRTPVLQDALNEGSETLKLTATNQAGAAASDHSTIKDDGTGSVFLSGNNTSTPNSSGDPGYPSYLDDDRPVTVNSIAVNEGSPKAVFAVTGTSGQIVRFALSDLSAAVEDGDGTVATDGSEDYGPSLEIYNGTSWVAYTPGTDFTLTGTTTYVRTAIVDDTSFEGQHSFVLGVTKQSNSKTVYGTADIYDDGTGSYWIGDATDPATNAELTAASVTLDDDRTISVDSPTVNEASDYVVFTVSGNSGQTASLAIVEGVGAGYANIDEIQTLQVWDGMAWVDYDSTNLPTFDANGKIYVRVDIQAEQDAPYEGSETFTLNATLTGQSAAASGVATIKDDGTGVKYPGTFTSGAPTTQSTGLDDDRRADLVTVKTRTSADATPDVGDTVTFRITVTNGGSDTATNVTLTESWPSDLTFGSATASAGSYNSGTGVWTIGTLTNGQSVTLDLTGTVKSVADGTVITNTTTKATADQTDPTDTGNDLTEGVTASNSASADLVTTKVLTSSDSTPDVGDTVTFTITVTNNGPAQATGVTLTESWPNGLNFGSVTASQGTYNRGTGVWTIGTLANGASETLVLTGTVKAGQGGNTLTNTVTAATGDQTDPTNTGNDLTESVTVTDDLPPRATPVRPPEPPAPPPRAPIIDITPPPTPVTVRVIDVPAPGTALGETRFIQTPQPNRVNPDQNIGSPELRVARNIPDQNFGQPGQEVRFAIPADTFVHTDSAASVSLNAVMVDGQALPTWLVFDPAKGEFRGVPPEGFTGELVVKVMARDDNGRQAETIVRIRFGDQPARTGAVGRPSLASQFERHSVFAWKMERDRLIQQAKDMREADQERQVA